MRGRSFWGMTAAQFFGAFNDNLFKQLILLLAVSGGLSAADAGGEAPDRQGMAMVIFAAPFVLFSGFFGFVSDRWSKTRIIVSAKVAEIVIMLLGVGAFYVYLDVGLTGVFAVLFLMGLQSAYFGPAKYGVLPEMLKREELPAANGIFLMTTFVAIIMGTAAAGFLKGKGAETLWTSAIWCVAVAVAGTLFSLLIRRIPPAAPDLQLKRESWWIPREIRVLMTNDRELLAAVVAATVFWLLGGLVQQTVNALGVRQLDVGDVKTSIMAACMAVGIATGCVLGGAFSRGRVNYRIVRIGAWGVLICLVFVSLPGREQWGIGHANHLLGFAGSLPVLLAMGVFAGMFVVPLQVLVQTRPPEGQKGRMIAALNICTWIGILLSGALYEGCAWLIAASKPDAESPPRIPEASVFLFTAVIMLPVAIYYTKLRHARS